MLGSAYDMLKDFISALIEGVIGMFVGVFKHILRVLKEGVKIGMQAYSVLLVKIQRTCRLQKKVMRL